MKVNEGQMLHGFELQDKGTVEEINSDGYLFVHKQSGAKLYYLANDDDNKVFSISFRTPPTDSTGLPHILEHAVLCGSRKFKAKDPFIELAKGSLNTFLNAMTFSDKTMYPIASQNPQDFKNLMDVYLDAVFYPNIYGDTDILRQEGWYHELENPGDEIKYNGVVYNEMKGAFSSPDQILFRKIQEHLFPDNVYGNESGGDPDVIPELTYKDFLDFHRKFYHPSNAYIYLYGNGDMEEHLKFINEEYLKDFEAKEIDSSIPMHPSFEKPHRAVEKYPISDEESEENKTYLSLNYAVGDSRDPEFYLAFDILNHILLESPAAPLKKALLDAEIGEDVLSSYDESLLQHNFSVIVKGANPEDEEKFLEVIYKTLEKTVEEGIDKKLIEGAINATEFELREADYGRYPKGLIYGIKTMDTWLYDAHPSIHLQYEAVFKKIRQALTTDYFEKMIDKYLLNNNHQAILTLVPTKGMIKERDEEIKKDLQSYKEKLSKEELDVLVKETKTLKKKQGTPDKKEELETIPQLSREDIRKKTEKLPQEIRENLGMKVLYAEHYTNKILYTDMVFDLRVVPQELIPYASLLGKLLGRVATKNYGYEDLSNEMEIYTGGIGFRVENFVDLKKPGQYHPKMIVQGSALRDKSKRLFELMGEIIENSKFENKKRIREIIKEMKSRLEMAIQSEGHMVAVRHLGSHYSEAEMFMEQCSGITFYKFIAKLDKDFEAKFEELQQNLEKVRELIFNKQNGVFVVTGDSQDYQAFAENSRILQVHLKDEVPKLADYHFELKRHNVGIANSSKVQYVAKGYNFKELGYEYTGHLQVLKTIISLNYLWNKIRIEGGAYGAMTNFSRSGNMFFTSYRDPHLNKTIDTYNKAEDYVRSFEADEREMTKYILGTISKVDAPMTPSAKGEKAATYYFCNITHEDLEKEREEIVSTTVEDIQAQADLIRDVMAKNYLCVVGNEHKLKDNKDLFNEIDPIFKK